MIKTFLLLLLLSINPTAKQNIDIFRKFFLWIHYFLLFPLFRAEKNDQTLNDWKKYVIVNTNCEKNKQKIQTFYNFSMYFFCSLALSTMLLFMVNKIFSEIIMVNKSTSVHKHTHTTSIHLYNITDTYIHYYN